MRSRLLKQIPQALRSSSSTGGGRRPMIPSSSASSSSLSSSSSSQSRTTTIAQKMNQHQQQRQALQQRLFSTNNTNVMKNTSRIALGVEGCSAALTLLLEGGVGMAEPNLPRGWDAGVAVDDDGG
mmetsp:Transcript_46442/g.97600  ORF Transcript_46442/g.97600 Transcript_46442/m.97600 type:complete len:125 (-) Transcript_46442:250-624(-)|eukprot:CAMPEP_0183712010 /NCGR_PEP_ID=MMETSP0737-20130205/7300_1 /TAXON_ID=385413 /ORGANISM="Thalassiosira miniscula, Strain CCMP1093" /LENGTH=124 /DNA_ID=CAMNT_0025940585 /DNA_START=72 /DNA_END=446 /DNA_ORIENTATION=-